MKDETFTRDDVKNLMDVARKDLLTRIKELEDGFSDYTQAYQLRQSEVVNKYIARIAELEAENERLRGQVRQTAIDFAGYMQSEAWEHDYREQKTHNLSEHYKYFSASSPESA